LLLAALLLPFDVASRRLILTRRDWVRLRDWVLEKLEIRKAPAPQESAPHVQALFKAKSRAHEEMHASQPLPSPEPPAPAPAATSQKPEPAPEPKKVPQERSPQSSPPEESASTTASLLARKKSLRKKRD
jgi:hypothetical protein